MYIPEKTFRVVREFPHTFDIRQHEWIRMKDGCRLSAKIWMPKIAETKPVPAILEFIPYRKRDITSYRDSINHSYFAGHGFACVRVDVRGSGDSEGVLTDEYLQTELDDGYEIIEWIAKQNWCSGSVGMMGKSWGGFNALQIAAMKPPALKAIISVSSSDDRFSTDVHYMGGCLLGDNLSWASEMFAFNACPPDPEIQGDMWKENWLKRLDESGVWLKTWLEHPFRDDYWKHGSICENYNDIQIPVFAISGWADGYSNTVFRLVENLKAPCLGLIGPWGHNYPHLGMPGPGMGFLQEAVEWWDQWLNGKESGIMEKPKLRVWMQESTPPSFTLENRPGHWLGIDNWPCVSKEEKVLYLNGNKLHDTHEEEATSQLCSPLSVGLFAGKWCSFSSTPDLPPDQREEDGGALIFETETLTENVEILGETKLHLRLKVDKPVAMIAARLCDVASDGKVTRVTYGLLNLCHAKSSHEPQLITENQYFEATLTMNQVAQQFKKGHRIRVSLSTSYWPIVWTPPEAASMVIDHAKSFASLPIHQSSNSLSQVYQGPEGAAPLLIDRIQSQNYKWRVIRDLGLDESQLSVIKDEGQFYIPSVDIEVQRQTEELYTYKGDRVDSVAGEVKAIRSFARQSKNWQTSIEAFTKLTSDKTHFYIDANLDAWQQNKRIFCKSWHYPIKRKFI